MPLLENAKHEKFAQLVAGGAALTVAYAGAGYTKHDCNASRLNRNEKVRERIKELQQAASEAATVDAAWVFNELQSVYRASMESGRYSSAVRSLELMGKSLGLFAEADPMMPTAIATTQVIIEMPDNGRDPLTRYSDPTPMLSVTG